jgi:hypothetical protein
MKLLHDFKNVEAQVLDLVLLNTMNAIMGAL